MDIQLNFRSLGHKLLLNNMLGLPAAGTPTARRVVRIPITA
jgi:hypothetical protein